MKKRAIWIILAFVFIASALILSIFFRQAVRDNFVLPLLKAWRLLQMVDRNIFWGGFIAFLYIVVIITLPPLQTSMRSFLTSDIQDRHLQKAAASPDREAEGQITFWLREVVHLQRDHFRTRFSVVELRRLVLETIAFRQNCTLHEAELWLEDKENRAPQEVRSLLHVEPQVIPHLGRGSLFWLWKRLQAWMRTPSPQAREADENKLEIIIQFLEKQQEVVHDHRNI